MTKSYENFNHTTDEQLEEILEEKKEALVEATERTEEAWRNLKISMGVAIGSTVAVLGSAIIANKYAPKRLFNGDPYSYNYSIRVSQEPEHEIPYTICVVVAGVSTLGVIDGVASTSLNHRIFREERSKKEDLEKLIKDIEGVLALRKRY